MKGNRSRVAKPAVAVWLLVLLADTAAAAGSTAVLWLGTAVVVVAGLVGVAVASRPRAIPVRMRARRHVH
jgi:hypothetical protein